MLGLKDIENSFETIADSMKKRGRTTQDLEKLREFIMQKNQMITELDELRAKRNQKSSLHKGKIEDETLLTEMKDLKQAITLKEEDLNKKEKELEEILFEIPNILDESVPFGVSEEENQEVFRWGIPKQFSFTPKPHDELGKALDILDIERGVKLSGSRFYVLKKEGALLERAIAQFFLERAIQAGYTEMFTPFLVKDKTMFGTGQLPKFKDEVFKIEGEELYLIPTAEVPLTAFYQNEILKEQELPLHFCAHTSCFRKEAGSYGKDTKGIFRVHQFQKVELVHYSLPEDSMQELEKMVAHSESLLQALELPYRKVLLCSGDTGFNSMKTYDLEVFLPFENRYREISSCSNCGDFQARRANIKYKNSEGKNILLHTLNGSGLAVGRTWVAILENYQNEDGSITVPTVLQKYMYGLQTISGV